MAVSVPRRNLILISLDTYRADVAYSGRLAQFERIRQRGVAFLNTVASAPITPVSHASVFTALHPYEHGIRHLFRERLLTTVPTLAELMAAAGYDCGAIVACPGLNAWYGMNRGFRHYDDEVPRLADGRDPLKLADVKLRGTALKRAPLVVERALSWLEGRRHHPFFLFIHFFDTHWPYEPPEWFAPEGANPYEGEAHYVDHYLGQFLDALAEWRLLDDALLIAFGDHGEDLAGWYPNDHAGEELGHPEENGHGALLFDATQMVPLVVACPELVPVSREISAQVRLIDILPTITSLLHVDDPAARSGESLTPLLNGSCRHRLAYCETYYREEQSTAPEGVPGLGPWHAVRIDNRYKMIFDVNSGEVAAYDLESDPNEMAPVKFASPDVRPLLHRQTPAPKTASRCL